MKSFKSFIKQVKKQLIDYYSDRAIVEVTEVLKTNGKRETGLSIVFKDKDAVAVPVIYMDSLYQAYKDGATSIEECVERIIEIRAENNDIGCFENITDIISNWEVAKSCVYPRLINTKYNKELLESLVHYDFLDLSVIFIIRGQRDKDGGFKSIKITKDLFNNYGIDMDTLKEVALKNMKADNYKFERMEDIFRLMEDRPDERSDERSDDEALECAPGNMYVLSNNGGIFGATGVLDEELLKKNLKDKDFYLIPSSVHEMIVVPAESVDVEELTEMIHSVNDTVVNVTDRLSNHPYLYKGITQQLMCA